MAPMAKRDRAAYMRNYRATRKQDQERTETVTVRLTAAELGALQRMLVDDLAEYGPGKPATFEDALLAHLRQDAAPVDWDELERWDALPEAERARTPHPCPEYRALMATCHASGCTCPVEAPDPTAAQQWLAGAAMPGRTWRRCAATGGDRIRPSMTPAQ